MSKIHVLLRSLARPEVAEVLLASGEQPYARTPAGDVRVAETSLSSDAILGLLFAAGGSRYLDDLTEKPTVWRTRVEGVGQVLVTATQAGDALVARFSVPGRPIPAPTVRTSKRPKAPSSASRRAKSSARMDVQRAPAPDEVGAVSSRNAARTVPVRRPQPATPPGSLDVSEPFELDLDDRRGAGGARQRAPDRPADALRRLIADGRAKGASDVHLVANRPPLFRLRGELESDGPVLSADTLQSMTQDLVPPRLGDTLSRTGSCDFAVELSSLGRVRVNVSRQRTGIKASLRLVPLQVPTLASLALPDEIAQATRHHQGLIVVTGPSGHGKTSTLAAIVDVINRETTHHVITVEDPVEIVFPRERALISQREVGTHTRSFQSALKASLREDPDVIVVGELRDAETVRMALSASETGHLVVGTMSTPSAAKTIDRLIDLFPPADQQQVRVTLAGGLRLVISQRLLPTADGKSRAAAVELLPGSLALWNLIRDSKTFQIPSLQQRGRGAGIVRLDDSLGELVKAGTVTLAAARAVAEAPDELAASVAGARGAQRPQELRPTPPAAGRGLLDRAGALFGRGDAKKGG